MLYYSRELWPVLLGVKLAVDKDCNKIMVEYDSQVAASLLVNMYPSFHPSSPLVKTILHQNTISSVLV